jgi:16S rRNA C967 or C1407 C5-methylase (RsmB/RsmF family)
MTEPSRSVLKLASSLFDDPARQDEFLAALNGGISDRQGLVWLVDRPNPNPFLLLDRPNWLPDFADVLAPDQHPGANELHTSGAIYCLDVSSIFCGSIALATPINPNLALDVCAAPGGKAIITWRGLKPSKLICNEVIGKRSGQLISNIRRCGLSGAEVVRHDSSILAETLKATCDLVVVDAPCSGQSLIARGQKSPGCFHVATVNMNSNRQKRILANSAKTVTPGGFLAYMTCTYSAKENEDVVRWLLKKFPNFTAVPVPTHESYQSALSDIPCYRLFPQAGQGAGGFCCLMRNAL